MDIRCKFHVGGKNFIIVKKASQYNTFHVGGKNFIIVKKASQYNTDDPLDQIAGTIGWKATFASVVLNTSCGIHLMAVRN